MISDWNAKRQASLTPAYSGLGWWVSAGGSAGDLFLAQRPFTDNTLDQIIDGIIIEFKVLKAIWRNNVEL